jgi:predicted signal transduction protein with EAL and GGDEF domain
MQLLDQPLELGEHTVHIGASVGIAIYPEDAREIESLCIAADLRMYEAKHDAYEGLEKKPVSPTLPAPWNRKNTRANLQVVD